MGAGGSEVDLEEYRRRMDTDTDFDGFFAVCHFCLPTHKSSHTTKTIDDCF